MLATFYISTDYKEDTTSVSYLQINNLSENLSYLSKIMYLINSRSQPKV